MQYVLLIYLSEEKWAAMPPADVDKVMAEYGAFTESIVKSGHEANAIATRWPS